LHPSSFFCSLAAACCCCCFPQLLDVLFNVCHLLFLLFFHLLIVLPSLGSI
jgi:hypothetical protein